MELANPRAFVPLFGVPCSITGRNAAGASRTLDCRCSVAQVNPYAGQTGGAASAEAWSVEFLAPRESKFGFEWPRKGGTVEFPGRPDLPCLFIQESRRNGGVAHLTCTSSERTALP